MPLPDPPTEQHRELLQAIWRFTTVNLRWPIAEDLEPSPTDEVINELPAEFARIVQHRPEWAGRPELALTVAGVAACDRSDPVLEAFLNFLTKGPSVGNGVDQQFEWGVGGRSRADSPTRRRAELVRYAIQASIGPAAPS
jgi:hypothetical protein